MTPVATRPRYRPDASMALIQNLIRESGDAYLAASRRAATAARDPSGADTSSRTRRWPLVLVTVLLGFGIGTAILVLRQPLTAPSPVKSDLTARIQAQRVAGQDAADRIDRLREELRRLQGDTLAGAGSAALAGRLEQLEQQVGAVAVTGPGLTLTLDDAPEDARPARPQPGGGAGEDGTVLARDLQQIVNAVWSAGAEAVDVNGNRLLATTSIRFAGRAVVVGFRPLSRPYVVTAIGPPDLARRLAAGAGGQYLEVLRRVYRIRADVAEPGVVTVPAGPALSARYARALPTGSPATTQEGTVRLP